MKPNPSCMTSRTPSPKMFHPSSARAFRMPNIISPLRMTDALAISSSSAIASSSAGLLAFRSDNEIRWFSIFVPHALHATEHRSVRAIIGNALWPNGLQRQYIA